MASLHEGQSSQSESVRVSSYYYPLEGWWQTNEKMDTTTCRKGWDVVVVYYSYWMVKNRGLCWAWVLTRAVEAAAARRRMKPFVLIVVKVDSALHDKGVEEAATSSP